jgi:hypothetical protein
MGDDGAELSDRFVRQGPSLVFDIPAAERSFLSQVLVLLAEVDDRVDDPGHRRLNVPVYLDDSDANEEWWRLMGEELGLARSHDRDVYEKVVTGDGPTVVDEDEASSFLRVLNEGRLAFAARLGLEVAEDHDRIPEAERSALDYLGWVLEDLTIVLMSEL